MIKIYENQNLDITGGFVDIEYASDTNRIFADYSATFFDNGVKSASLTIRVQTLDVTAAELNAFIDELKSVKEKTGEKEFRPFKDETANDFTRSLEVLAIYNIISLKKEDFDFSIFSEINLPKYGAGKTAEEVVSTVKACRKALLIENGELEEEITKKRSQIAENNKEIAAIDRMFIGCKPKKL